MGEATRFVIDLRHLTSYLWPLTSEHQVQPSVLGWVLMWLLLLLLLNTDF